MLIAIYVKNVPSAARILQPQQNLPSLHWCIKNSSLRHQEQVLGAKWLSIIILNSLELKWEFITREVVPQTDFPQVQVDIAGPKHAPMSKSHNMVSSYTTRDLLIMRKVYKKQALFVTLKPPTSMWPHKLLTSDLTSLTSCQRHWSRGRYEHKHKVSFAQAQRFAWTSQSFE